MGLPGLYVFFVFVLAGIAGPWYIRNSGSDGLLRRMTNNRRGALSLGFLAMTITGFCLTDSIFERRATVDEIVGVVTASKYTGRSLTGQDYLVRTNDGRTTSLGWERPEQLLASAGDRADIRFNHYSGAILRMTVLSGKHQGLYEPLPSRKSDSYFWFGLSLFIVFQALWRWFKSEPAKIDETALQRRIDSGPEF